MTIPLEVLQSWAKPGRNEMSKQTYAALREVLLDNLDVDESDIYLQGSYRNSTNVRDNSDIDIVIEFEPGTNLYALKDSALISIQNSHNFQFTKGSKTVKYKGLAGRYVPADIVPCVTERGAKDCVRLYDSSKNTVILNYPKVHIRNGEEKSGNTDGNFKKGVRILKNARNYLENLGVNTQVSSYTIECLLYNIPDDEYSGNESDILNNTVDWVLNNQFSLFWLKTQDRKEQLFINPERYTSDVVRFFNNVRNLQDKWEKTVR